MATALDRITCLLFPFESGCLENAAAAGRVSAEVAALEGAAGEARDSVVDEIGEAGERIIGATGEPTANIAETARWATIGIIAIAVVVLALMALFLFFYLRGFR